MKQDSSAISYQARRDDLTQAVTLLGDLINHFVNQGIEEDAITLLCTAKRWGEWLATIPNITVDELVAFLSLALERIEVACAIGGDPIAPVVWGLRT